MFSLFQYQRLKVVQDIDKYAGNIHPFLLGTGHSESYLKIVIPCYNPQNHSAGYANQHMQTNLGFKLVYGNNFSATQPSSITNHREEVEKHGWTFDFGK